MRNLPIIVGLKPNGNVGTFYRSITRTHLISAALILLSLFSISLLIALIGHGHNHRKNNNNVDQYCLDRGCLSAATHQLRFMNNTVSADRCRDFYNYACGYWQQTHPIQSFHTERTILSDIIDRRDADIEHLLNAPISRLSPQSWEWKVKTYYTECLDDHARVSYSGKAMIQLIRDQNTINGWFLLDNSALNDSQEFLLINQTVCKQISHIHGELGATVIFDLRVRFDDIDPNIKRIEFFPAGLSMEINDYLSNDSLSERRRSIYQLYILEILALLAQDAEISDENLNNRMFTVAADIFSIEKTLAEYFQHSEDNGDQTVLITLQEISNRYSFDFVQLMTHELGDSSIVSGSTSVYVTNPTYFQEAFLLLSKNNNPLFARLIHNYMRWRLVRTYIEDLSYNYIHAHQLFLDNYYNFPLHSSNEGYCTREVIRKFPLAIQRLYTMNSTAHLNTIQTIETIFNALKDGFKQYINEQATWITDQTTKTIAKQKIDALTVAIGYASIASDDARLDNYYEKFGVDDKSHFENAYSYYRFHRWIISNSLINPNQLDHWDLFETRTSQLFDYIPILNRLFVIANAMDEPLVNAEWPWSMNLGSLGVLLAQKLFASIDGPEGRIHSANGTRIPDWWSSSTINAYNTIRQCIIDYYVNHVEKLSHYINDAKVLVQLTGEPFSSMTIRHIGALRFTYMALKKNDQIKSLKMPGTKLTNEQTFFLAYAQTQCYQRQDLIQLSQTQLGIYDEKTALNAALVHMPEFMEAFQCKSKENTCF